MKSKKSNRREFLQTSVAGLTALSIIKESSAVTETTFVEPHAELLETTIFDLQAKMKSGELTAKKLVEMYSERIREVDPKIRSVLEINPDALQIAEKLDQERKKG